MKRRNVSRLLLLMLAVLTVLLILRTFIGPPRPKGIVSLYGMPVNELMVQQFEVESPVRLAVHATGSFEVAGRPDAALAAYAWIIRKDDRRVIWRMNPAVPKRGTLASVADTLQFTPGMYQVYFTSYGNNRRDLRNGTFFGRLANTKLAWQNDRKKWSVLVAPATGEATMARPVHYSDGESEDAPPPADLIWTTKPVDDNEERAYVFEIKKAARIRVYSIGEITARERSDYGWIESTTTGENVWEMTFENTRPAGGAVENRVFDGFVTLAPGVYRAMYRTNDRHAAGNDWIMNPPYDPEGWGLTLRTEVGDAAAVAAAFDPWSTRRPLLDLTQVPSENVRSVKFTVKQPIEVVVAATGELLDDGKFDYGWIRDTKLQKNIWEMSMKESQPAGGGDKNREQLTFLKLEPGTYTLNFQTDDSHAYGDWNTDEPTHPERWGVAVFSLAPELPAGAFEQIGDVVVMKHPPENAGEPGAGVEARPSDVPPPPPMPDSSWGEQGQ